MQLLPKLSSEVLLLKFILQATPPA